MNAFNPDRTLYRDERGRWTRTHFVHRTNLHTALLEMAIRKTRNALLGLCAIDRQDVMQILALARSQARGVWAPSIGDRLPE